MDLNGSEKNKLNYSSQGDEWGSHLCSLMQFQGVLVLQWGGLGGGVPRRHRSDACEVGGKMFIDVSELLSRPFAGKPLRSAKC